MAAQIANKPSFISYGKMRFLIIDAPTDANLSAYLREFQSFNVTDVVRACNPSYNTGPLVKVGLTVHEMPFTDGDPPPKEVIDRFLALCDTCFSGPAEEERTIAVHCVAGLGRAPVLVAIALIDAGLEPLDAVGKVRTKRRGAINAKQLNFLEHEYKRRGGGCCTIM